MLDLNVVPTPQKEEIQAQTEASSEFAQESMSECGVMP